MRPIPRSMMTRSTSSQPRIHAAARNSGLCPGLRNVSLSHSCWLALRAACSLAGNGTVIGSLWRPAM